MHVLKVVPWLFWADGRVTGRYFLDQSEALHEAGIAVRILHPAQRSIANFSLSDLHSYRFQNESHATAEGIEVLSNWGWRVPKAYMLSASIMERQINKLFSEYVTKHGVPDLLHSESALSAGAIAADIAARYEIPLVVTEHQSYLLLNRPAPSQARMVRETLGKAEVVTAVSAELADVLRHLSGRKAIAVVPNMVDVSFFHSPSRRCLEPFVITTVCHLVRQKQVDLLVRAFAHAFPRSEDVCLRIVGDGPERDCLVALCRQLRVADRVHFLGHVDKRRVREVLWGANLFVLPSKCETFGIALIEAAATGLPIVTSARGGPRSFVSELGGRLLVNDEATTLAAVLLDEYERRDERIQQQGMFSIRVRERFSKRMFVESWKNIYSKAAGNYI